MSPHIWIDPGRQWGLPCLGGTRVPVNNVCSTYYHHGLDEVQKMYEIDRARVLLCCWYEGTFEKRTKRGMAWFEWAVNNHEFLWRGEFEKASDPPRLEGGKGKG